MCYQFNHNEQEAMWQSDIIYTLELTQWGGLENSRVYLEINGNFERSKAMETMMATV